MATMGRTCTGAGRGTVTARGSRLAGGGSRGIGHVAPACVEGAGGRYDASRYDEAGQAGIYSGGAPNSRCCYQRVQLTYRPLAGPTGTYRWGHRSRPPQSDLAGAPWCRINSRAEAPGMQLVVRVFPPGLASTARLNRVCLDSASTRRHASRRLTSHRLTSRRLSPSRAASPRTAARAPSEAPVGRPRLCAAAKPRHRLKRAGRAPATPP